MLVLCIGMYRKYDDVMRTSPGWFGLGTIDFKRNRLLALEAMLPKWSGFCGQSTEMDQYGTAKEVIAEFLQVVVSVVNVPMWEDNQPEQNLFTFCPRDLSGQTISAVSHHLFVKANSVLRSLLYYLLYMTGN